jgi:hypothetical protein
MPNDIIDNRTAETLLATQLKTRHDVSEAAKFAIRYFFLSGFEEVLQRDRAANPCHPVIRGERFTEKRRSAPFVPVCSFRSCVAEAECVNLH